MHERLVVFVLYQTTLSNNFSVWPAALIVLSSHDCTPFSFLLLSVCMNQEDCTCRPESPFMPPNLTRHDGQIPFPPIKQHTDKLNISYTHALKPVHCTN